VEAVKQWETGVEKDPSYSGNYYHLARFYNARNENVWSALYGEIFVNIESLTARTAEIKDIILESYKRLFNSNDLLQAYQNSKSKNEFTKAWLSSMNKQLTVASSGIGTETLVMIRTRFILDWYAAYAAKFPFKLFDHQRELLQQGLFDAYNQWLFGASSNISEFQNWTGTHKEEYAGFTKLQRSRIFKVPAGQYYQGK
jgi:hypothetical protein